MRKKVLLCVLAGLVIAAAAPVWGAGKAEKAQEQFNWKLAGGNPPAALETKAAQRFVDLTKERSGGKIILTLYPSFQLGDSVALMEMASAGEVEIVCNTASWHTRFVPEWEILSFPYVVKSPEHLRRIHQSAWFKGLEEKYYRTKRIKIIANNGFRLPRQLLHRTKGLITPADLAGVKLRKADAKIFVQPWKDLGAEVLIVPWAETAVALQTGMVHAMGAPSNTIFPQKFYEGAPHVTLTNHQMDTLDLFMSASHWEKLNQELQKVLTSSGEDALKWYAEQMDSVWAEDRKKLEAAGVKFYEPDMNAWRAKVLEVAKAWEARGEWEKGLFEKIQSY